jgi:hypothetical protein
MLYFYLGGGGGGGLTGDFNEMPTDRDSKLVNSWRTRRDTLILYFILYNDI